MKVNSKGFTLIELLAVIVILAILALIAVPIVLNIINDAKQTSEQRSVKSYIYAVSLALENNTIIDDPFQVLEGVYSITNDGNICIEEIDNNTCNKFLEIDVNGLKPTGGSIQIKENKIIDYDLDINGKTIFMTEPTDISCFEVSENSDGTLTISKYLCGKSNTKGMPEILNVIIPRKINGKYVSKIGSSAFEKCRITDVEIPNTVTDILSMSFRYNNLTNIIIPNSVVSIGLSAFQANSLTNISFPNSLISIGNSSFQGNKLTSIEFSNSIITIGNSAFSANQLTSVKIPSNIMRINNSAFSGNKLTNVIIEGKKDTSDFLAFGSNVFGWSEGYSDSNIIWQ